jgi:protein O-GlcNAc transferase
LSEGLPAVRRLHVGGLIRVPGWEVFNAVPGPHVDHVGDARDLTRFAAGTFTEMYASHVLEHFDYKDALEAVLRAWRRVLVPGGTLHLSVPDLDTLCRLFLQRARFTVSERFLIMRMIFGGHVDEHDVHLAGLNQEFLVLFLRQAGFVKIRRVQSLGLFQDTSTLALAGTPISLNLIARAPQAG